jgi:phosphoglycolate phosphatase
MLPHLEPHLPGKRKILWDWNGTLLDDLRVCVEAIAEEMRLRGLEPVDEARYRELFGFPVRDYYAKLGFDFARHPFEEVGGAFLRRFHARLHECRLHPGRRETLEALQARGIRQSILSAAHEPALHAQVRGQGIEHLFERVYGLDDEHAAGKVERGRELMRDLGVDPRETLLVGDTDHDLEVGRALGVDVVLVADGHQNEERLRSRHDRVLASGT